MPGHQELAAGLGSFGYKPIVQYSLGTPTALHPGGAVMNMPIVNITKYDGSSSSAQVNYAFELGGVASMLEHSIPDQIFAGLQGAADSISAISALWMASQPSANPCYRH